MSFLFLKFYVIPKFGTLLTQEKRHCLANQKGKRGRLQSTKAKEERGFSLLRLRQFLSHTSKHLIYFLIFTHHTKI